MMTVAEMIKKTRTDHNMTQEEYGNKFGITRQSVSSWENGKSLPDLQMLIDICNTYHISLDTLLNENHEFVYKVDFANHVFQNLKKTIKIIAVLVIVTGIMILAWALYANEKNADFVNAVTNEGFVMKNQCYEKIEDGVIYSVPNQKIPFAKTDFYVKQVYAEENTGKYLVVAISAEQGDYEVTVNNETLKAKQGDQGDDILDTTGCSEETRRIVKLEENNIRKTVKKVQEIYDRVYN